MSNIILALILFQPIEVKEYNLDNGLKVLIYEDHFAPMVSTQVYYRVGSYNEPEGLTGISHLLEHMAYKSTKNYTPKEYEKMIDEAGGINNGFTSVHMTAYWTNLSSDRYELALKIEADRMQNLLLLQDEFVPEKGVVMEERRLGENDPGHNLNEYLDLISFSYSPYRHSIIGFMSDLEQVNRDDVYNWYKKYYNPANAVIVIAGDVNPDEALKLVKKYYGKIKGKKVPDAIYTELPQAGERRFELRKDVETPLLAIQYHTVPANHIDMHALDVVSMILSSGLSSRFEKHLIREKGIALEVRGYHSNMKYDGTFAIFAMPQTHISIEALEKEILNEIEKLKTEPVTDAELTKAKNRALAKALYRQDAVDDMGFEIGSQEIDTGMWENMNRYPGEIGKVTTEEIMAAVKKYLVKDNRTVGYLLPQEEK